MPKKLPTNNPPCPSCGQPLAKDGKQGKLLLQRFRCRGCGLRCTEGDQPRGRQKED